MNPLLLAAVLCAALAAPALAASATSPGDKDAGKIDKAPEFDFTVRPQLRPVAVRSDGGPDTKLTLEESNQLKDSLFASYQNIGALGRFRFHVRTPNEPPMPPADLAWVEEELTKAAAAAEKLEKEADKALRIGVTRRVRRPYEKGSSLLGRLLFRSLKYARSARPTIDEYRRDEIQATSDIQLGLYALIGMAADPIEDVDPDEKNRLEKDLAENRKAREEHRRAILGIQQRAIEEEQLRNSSVDEARERVKNATKRMGFNEKNRDDDGKKMHTGETEPSSPPAGGGESGGITPEEAARRANAVPRANSTIKRKPAASVPAP